MPKPSKPTPKDTPTPKPQKRGRRRREKIEDHPDVVAWCERFVERTKEMHGFEPTRDQALLAFVREAVKAIERANA